MRIIEGVEPLGWGCGRDDTFHGALVSAARAMGRAVSYDEVMVLSGAAFRLQFHRPDWCPSSADATCGHDCTAAALEAAGLRGRWRSSERPLPAVVRELLASLEQRRPIVAIQLDGPPDWGLIVGSPDRGATWLCHTYWSGAGDPVPARNWPWALLLLEPAPTPPDREALFRAALRRAAALWESSDAGPYACGRRAYACWISDLRDDARFDGRGAAALRRLAHIHAICYGSLLDARRAAARYLARRGQERAAAAYAALADWLERNRDACAPYPWRLEASAPPWPGARRHAAADVLEQAARLEGEAVQALSESA